MAAASGSESRRAATRMDTYHGGVTSASISSPDTLVHVERTHPNKVLEGLNRLRLNRALCDVVLCCGGKEFPCHRYVLASFSPYFEAMFTSGMVESTQEKVTISAVEPQLFEMLVNYAYTSEVSISAANVQALLVASNLLDIIAIRRACCEYMKRHMNITNCVGIHGFAEAQCCEMLAEHSMHYILEHFSSIYQQEEFLSLSVEELSDILASDHLNVPKEDMVFEAAMLWLDKCPTRSQNFEKVLEQIRLPLISPSYLHTVIESLDVVKEHRGCQRFISEAKDQPFCNTARPRTGHRTTVIVIVTEVGLLPETAFQIESFDPLTNQWKTLGRLPLATQGSLPAQDPATFKSGRSTLYLTGGSGSHREEMFCYDISHNSWWSAPLAPMNEPRGNFSMVKLNAAGFDTTVMLDGYGYAFNGFSLVEKYGPSGDTWQLVDSVDVSEVIEERSTMGALEGHLYFTGEPLEPLLSTTTPVCGVDSNDVNLGSNTMERYDPETNRWTLCAPMKERRYSGHSAVVVDGKMFVLGGVNGENVEENEGNVYQTLGRLVQAIESYCEETDTWETVGQIPDAVQCNGFSCRALKLRRIDYESI